MTRAKPKNLVYFPRETVYIRKICSVKLSTLGFEISSFSCLVVASVSQILSHLLWPGSWHVTFETYLSLALIRSPTQKVVYGWI